MEQNCLNNKTCKIDKRKCPSNYECKEFQPTHKWILENIFQTQPVKL